jgi:hypothetical protein
MEATKKISKTVQIKNPVTLARIAAERQAGYGRSITETAENLILKGLDALQQERLSASRANTSVHPVNAIAAEAANEAYPS